MNRDRAQDTFATPRAVIISGWNDGFKKVEFTKLLKDELGYSLSLAKSVTDRIVDKCRVELLVSESVHGRFTRLSASLGAIVADDIQGPNAKEKSCQ
jgi:hypothetical protein